MGQKQKTEKKKRDRKLVITMASYEKQTPPWVAYAKPPGPIYFDDFASFRLNDTLPMTPSNCLRISKVLHSVNRLSNSWKYVMPYHQPMEKLTNQ